MTKKDKRFEESVLDLVEQEILSNSAEDILETYSAKNFDEISDYSETQLLINNTLKAHKKNKLKLAREALDKARSEKPTNSESAITNAKNFIIDLMVSGKLPEGLTLAFRDGEDIPDEEVASIIEDLRSLGVNFDDE